MIQFGVRKNGGGFGAPRRGEVGAGSRQHGYNTKKPLRQNRF